MTEHTRGPWRVGYDDGSGGGNPDDYNDYFVITSVPTGDVVVSGASGDNDMKSWCVGIEDPDDARFIVTACNAHADLLAALEYCFPYMRSGMIDTAELDKIAAAIARAKGD